MGIFNVPNGFTLMRLVMAPVIAMEVLAGQYPMAFIMFVFAGTTDILDGWAARLMKKTTTFGAYFDPVADKVLMNTVCWTLVSVGILPKWFAIIVSIRDVGILVVAVVLGFSMKVRKFPPSKLGKASTFAQILLAGTYIGDIVFKFPFGPIEMIIFLLLGISTGLTVWSGFDYTRVIFKAIREENAFEAASIAEQNIFALFMEELELEGASHGARDAWRRAFEEYSRVSKEVRAKLGSAYTVENVAHRIPNNPTVPLIKGNLRKFGRRI